MMKKMIVVLTATVVLSLGAFAVHADKGCDYIDEDDGFVVVEDEIEEPEPEEEEEPEVEEPQEEEPEVEEPQEEEPEVEEPAEEPEPEIEEPQVETEEPVQDTPEVTPEQPAEEEKTPDEPVIPQDTPEVTPDTPEVTPEPTGDIAVFEDDDQDDRPVIVIEEVDNSTQNDIDYFVENSEEAPKAEEVQAQAPAPKSADVAGVKDATPEKTSKPATVHAGVAGARDDVATGDFGILGWIIGAVAATGGVLGLKRFF